MVTTLRMRFAGPMQSWGTRSRFDLRDTEAAPTKSGVLGLVAAALGRQRSTDLSDLAALRLGVRVDRPGVLMRDFHTAQEVRRADDSGTQPTAVSRRDYLADAVFLVGLEGTDRQLLMQIDHALEHPHWPLALGRRAFAPSLPVTLRPPQDPEPLVDMALEPALRQSAALVPDSQGEPVRYLFEDPNGEQEWFDQPLDNFAARTFAVRHVRVEVAPVEAA